MSNSTKKVLHRGYSDILKFVERLSRKSIPEEFRENPEASIQNFLDECYRKRLSVGRCLLDILVEFQKNDYKSSVASLVLSRCNQEKTVATLLEFFKSENVPDKVKRKLLLVLEYYKVVEDIPSLIKYFENKEWLATNALNSLLEKMESAGENIGILFQHLEGLPIEFYQALTANLTHRNDDASIWILGVLAEFSDEKVAENAIQALGYRKSALAYEILDNLITYRETKKDLRTKAMARLAQTGISKTNHRLLIPHKSYVSWIDAHGNTILLVSRRTGRGRLFMVTFMLNEENGVQDCTVWNSISTFEMDSLIKGLEKQVGLKQIDYTLGLKIVEDGLWTIVKKKKMISPTFLAARRIFGSQKLTPTPYQVNLDSMGIQYITKKIAPLLAVSNQLLSDPPFSEWALDSSEVLDKSILPSSGKKLRKETIEQFIETVFEKKRENWKHRFLMSAEFLQRTSPRTYRNQIEICLAIYLTLENGLPLKAIPFMVKLAELSISQMVFKSKKGEKNSTVEN